MKGADVNAETEDGRSPLDTAIFQQKDDVAALLKSKGAIVERYRCTTEKNGSTTTTLRHGQCPFPIDTRELISE